MIPQQNHPNQDIDYRMKLSSQLTRFLRKANDTFGDVQSLIGKNLTSTTFWFFVDALYYYIDLKQDIKQIERIQNSQKPTQEQFDELEDLAFILKIRNLISDQRVETSNLQDIKSTSIDQVIYLTEQHLHSVEETNKNKIQELKQKAYKQKQILKDYLKKYNIKLRDSHPMFMYQEFEYQIRGQWMEQDIKLASKQRCFLCSHPGKLIACKSCSLKVHPACYPTFTHRFDSKVLRPTDEELKNFVCQNCVNGVDESNQKCELCCCLGGNFLKTNHQQPNTKIKFQKQYDQNCQNKSTQVNIKVVNSSQQKKSKFIHLTCFIWNTELKWNHNINAAEGFYKIDKKKLNGICSLCGISYGSAIPCSNQSCRRFYHGQCAKRHNLEMNLIRAKTSVIELFCERHRHLNRYQSLQEAALNKFRQVKKMFEGIDKQIKRLNVTASYQQIKQVVQRDYCSICGKEEGRQKITTCKQCRKWYHNNCSSHCKNCV